jgi:Pericentrin-AKAP-450 domain of centrosomal targeting protein
VKSLGIKCAQLESWRKNLNWQKRYLLLVVGAFEASHHRLRLALKAPSPEPPSVNMFK